MCPPFRKRKKIVSDKDDDHIDDKLLHQVEENTNNFAFK
jgi:hypothetical protein